MTQKPWPLGASMSHTFRTAEDYRDHLPCSDCDPEGFKAYTKVKRMSAVQAILDAVRDEVSFAISKYPPMNSAHEGWAVIWEELDELWDEVRAKQGERSLDDMKTEAIQTAAMCIRFIMDICTAEKVQK